VRVGIIGAGHIGGGLAQFLAGAGHDVIVTFSREPGALERLAAQIGSRVSAAEKVSEAVADSEAVVVSVPWPVIDEALAAAGSLAGKVVIDTTNQFGAGSELIPAGQTAAQFNQARMPGAGYTKSFNTLTAGFQRQTAGRDGDRRVVQWLCGDDAQAKAVAAALITDCGFVPVDLGGTADATVMEAPRRPGAVYGEEYRQREAQAVVAAVRAGHPIPPAPGYRDLEREGHADLAEGGVGGQGLTFGGGREAAALVQQAGRGVDLGHPQVQGFGALGLGPAGHRGHQCLADAAAAGLGPDVHGHQLHRVRILLVSAGQPGGRADLRDEGQEHPAAGDPLVPASFGAVDLALVGGAERLGRVAQRLQADVAQRLPVGGGRLADQDHGSWSRRGTGGSNQFLLGT